MQFIENPEVWLTRQEEDTDLTAPLTCYRLISGLQMGYGLTKNGWKKEKWTKNDIFEPFSGDFSHFLASFAKIHFSATLPDFGPKARKQSVAGQQDRSGERVSAFLKIKRLLRFYNKKTPNSFKRAWFCNCNGYLNPQELGPVTVIGSRHSSMLWESQLVQ